ncbi:ankyrin repeat protein [Mollivirus sibericum]|uniref:ankyrin repeat protein n=1 Tax=Mollivirus sibericum TaxID=1678078 RepID=UPI0006B2E83E|nr:ankyrin repeat protein [Mollivirus sibericum]ALD62019.1 ankyrin repeat protein [Mollivirus sibericum]
MQSTFKSAEDDLHATLKDVVGEGRVRHANNQVKERIEEAQCVEDLIVVGSQTKKAMYRLATLLEEREPTESLRGALSQAIQYRLFDIARELVNVQDSSVALSPRETDDSIATSPLMLACLQTNHKARCEAVDFVKWLLRRLIDEGHAGALVHWLNRPSPDHFMDHVISNKRMHPMVFRLALLRGCDLGLWRDPEGRTPLVAAATLGNAGATRVLLKRSTDGIDSPINYLGETLLHDAATRYDYGVTKALLAKGADINCRTKQGLTPLHYAAIKGNVGIVYVLVRRGADTNIRSHPVGDGDQDSHAVFAGLTAAEINPRSYCASMIRRPEKFLA